MRATLAVLILVLGAGLLVPRALAAQRHAVTDRSLSSSLLGAAPPLPMTRLGAWNEAGALAARYRLDLQYSRSSGSIGSPLVIVGLRGDHPASDGTGRGAAVVGIRAGFSPEGKRGGGRMPTAMEIQLGARALTHPDDPRQPDVGFELVVGWSGLGDQTQGSMGVRIPVEYSLPVGGSSIRLSGAPTVAWGHIRFRECENLGYGDNCGDMGIQLEFGRTRFLLAGGVTLDLTPAGLAVSVGTQQLLVAGQKPRLAVGLAWAP